MNNQNQELNQYTIVWPNGMLVTVTASSQQEAMAIANDMWLAQG